MIRCLFQGKTHFFLVPPGVQKLFSEFIFLIFSIFTLLEIQIVKKANLGKIQAYPYGKKIIGRGGPEKNLEGVGAGRAFHYGENHTKKLPVKINDLQFPHRNIVCNLFIEKILIFIFCFQGIFRMFVRFFLHGVSKIFLFCFHIIQPLVSYGL